MSKTTINATLLSTGLLMAALGSAPFSFAQELDSGMRENSAKYIEVRNQEVMLKFYQKFFNNHDLSAASDLIEENYVQHNPNFATGRDAFVAAFKRFFQQSPQFHTQIVRMIADGNLVWIQSHQRNSPTVLGTEIIDIYRLQDGKIAEHWDSLVPVTANSANSNTQF